MGEDSILKIEKALYQREKERLQLNEVNDLKNYLAIKNKIFNDVTSEKAEMFYINNLYEVKKFFNFNLQLKLLTFLLLIILMFVSSFAYSQFKGNQHHKAINALDNAYISIDYQFGTNNYPEDLNLESIDRDLATLLEM